MRRSSAEYHTNLLTFFLENLKKPKKKLDSLGGGDIVKIKILEKLNYYLSLNSERLNRYLL
jgi:hypothetical protein